MQTFSHIRTFSGRHGRLSLTQKAALSTLLTKYQMPKGEWNFKEMFSTPKVVLEIGSGDGTAPQAFAQKFPDHTVIAIDVYTPGIAQLMHDCEKDQISNLKVMIGDAIAILKEQVLDQSLDAIHIFFPDPWPKKRHHKRRILNQSNLQLFLSKLKPTGQILIATDWDEYAQEIQENLSAALHSRPSWRPVTKFERRAIQEERSVSELIIQSKVIHS
jgi:tRNA (guanine-N7-)-methyltransferase